MDLLHTLADLTAAFGPAGCERGVARVIEKLAGQYCDEVSRDTMGNLICRKKGNGPRVMFAAHMDTIGLVATHIDEKGRVHVGNVGSIQPADVLHTPVRFQNGTSGAIGVDGKADRAKLKLSDLFIDVGASGREEAGRLVQIGDVAVYNTRLAESCGRVMSPYMDDRISCLVLLMVMVRLEKPENDLYFVFTVQEELGCRGAKTAAWTIDPDYGIAVDVTTSDDEPGSKHQASSVLGGGAAVKVMDRGIISHPQVVGRLMSLAGENDIKAQRDVICRGGTDAGAIHLTRGGVLCGGVSIPCRYTHSPMEMVDLSDVKACAKLIAAFASSKLEKVR